MLTQEAKRGWHTQRGCRFSGGSGGGDAGRRDGGGRQKSPSGRGEEVVLYIRAEI